MAPAKKTVLITGCTPGGIGHALALEFHRRGCHVIATARRLEVIKGLEAQGLSILALDVTSKESVASCKAAVTKLTGGQLDILVNNAGRPHVIPALDVDLDDARATYETNVFGPMRMIQSFIDLLIPARGLIVNISSASSEIPYLFSSVYSATKAALAQYSRVLRMELKPFNVRVMTCMAGTVRSNFASGPGRTLPSNSLYQPVVDFYERRLTFSQTTSTMPHDVFAKKLVSQALLGEGWLGGWVGRSPDYIWAGGMSTVVFLGTLLPRWMSEGLTAGYFQMRRMGDKIKAARQKTD
ncbi:short chain dehydrogenase [Hirsutella rhossiliensis]|uniref:Short chain dehydrogenase domain-containing protein n=1 Tax=Hirsutella rhossiliensis TaxID=111463 RepID=A0A9P8MP50_9HYPO|nr:short chain dehydrogenase domain-containing protein [Hirsutella rhossiliensis]KAH0958705.1 short chain dehydrogenase domain-containing protein [Hirsutella rhossiliensis]